MSLNFSQDLVLENNHVLLRSLQESDLEHLVSYAINEPNTWEYSMVRVDGKDNMIKYIQTAVDGRENQNQFPFIVFDKKSGKYVGSTRFYDIKLEFKTLQLGYTWYGAQFRGTGINIQCKYLLLQFAFETLGMERVEFRADNNNKRSIAAMKSIGCKEEGILRSHMPTLDSEVRRDAIILSILRNEWFDTVKLNLSQRIDS